MNSTKRLASALVFASATTFSLAAYPDSGNSTLDRASSYLRSFEHHRRDRHSEEHRPAIVGMWLTSLYLGPFKGERVDLHLQQFFADGNELMHSSGFDPKGGNICFGVWKDLGNNTFKIRHLGWGFDATTGAHIDTTRLDLILTVSEDGQTFSGTWTGDLINLEGEVVEGSFAEGDVRSVRFEVGGINVAPLFTGNSLSVKSLPSSGTRRPNNC